MNSRSTILLLALSTLIPQLSTAQGSLTPPAGPPVASMKTLDQVEARIPLVAGQPGVAVSAAGTITISQPGSYYLTKNVNITTNVNGIEINADATVDLNGFSIIGTAAAITTASAITVGDFHVVVKNGRITGGSVVMATPPTTLAGFRYGVYTASVTAHTISISDLTVAGVRETGILALRVGEVERSKVVSCGGGGIIMHTLGCTVANCFVNNCAGTVGGIPVGIRAYTVRNSTAQILAKFDESNNQPTGISATRVESSTGYADTLYFGVGYPPQGIEAKVAVYCTGKGAIAISTQVAVIGSFSEGGLITGAGSKHLGTP